MSAVLLRLHLSRLSFVLSLTLPVRALVALTLLYLLCRGSGAALTFHFSQGQPPSVALDDDQQDLEARTVADASAVITLGRRQHSAKGAASMPGKQQPHPQAEGAVLQQPAHGSALAGCQQAGSEPKPFASTSSSGALHASRQPGPGAAQLTTSAAEDASAAASLAPAAAATRKSPGPAQAVACSSEDGVDVCKAGLLLVSGTHLKTWLLATVTVSLLHSSAEFQT